MKRIVPITAGLLTAAAAGAQARPLSIEVLYAEFRRPYRPTLSNLVRPPADSGLQGARLALKDNAGTGRFLNHRYTLKTLVVVRRGSSTPIGARTH